MPCSGEKSGAIRGHGAGIDAHLFAQAPGAGNGDGLAFNRMRDIHGTIVPGQAMTGWDFFDALLVCAR
jgi:hypothetical protein